jgi:hypothetical protein
MTEDRNLSRVQRASIFELKIEEKKSRVKRAKGSILKTPPVEE